MHVFDVFLTALPQLLATGVINFKLPVCRLKLASGLVTS